MGSCKQTNVETVALLEENKRRAFLGQAQVSGSNCVKDSLDEDANDDETPQRKVHIAAFQMGKTEVTLGEFKKFIISSGRKEMVSDEFIKYNNKGDKAPVVMVSVDDIRDFISWLNKVENSNYRLPSEAEWEYACRAGGRHRYCGSNDFNKVGWYYSRIPVNNSSSLHEVGAKMANAWGLHDMTGNAAELVEDCWHNSYKGAPTNGEAWTINCNYGQSQVVRGSVGEFSNKYISEKYVASSRNHKYREGSPYGGFRVARSH